MSEELRRRGLGRGLSALLGEEEETSMPARGLRHVPIEQLLPGRHQPRRRFDSDAMKALTESVRSQGIIQPILVRRHPERGECFEILAGERRWRAAQAALLHEVPIVLREIGDREALEIALVENVQRQDLSPLEEAQGYQRLIDEFHHTQDELAQALGKSRSHIANTLRLLNLPPELKAMLDDGKLSAGHGRALLAAKEPLRLATEVLARDLNVRQTEALVKAEGAMKSDSRPRKDANVAAVERELGEVLGLKVSIGGSPRGGTVTIHYKTLDQFDDVLNRLRATPRPRAP
jgi:ParB family transcriptional regulator, chromosome partitioning protein